MRCTLIAEFVCTLSIFGIKDICVDLLALSRSQNSPPEGNGVHFMFEVASRLFFSEESDGADHFLKKGAQHAHLAHFWPTSGPN